MRINQNISAVIVNDQLLRNENTLSESISRLSSGIKFNKAKDNPSGVAISYKMRAQINALTRASKNTTDGISIVQTIDSAMSEVGDIIKRISELCVQAANGPNSLNDRKAVQMEIDSLKDEINRISSDTEFNGKALLDGSLDRRTYVTSTTMVQTDNIANDVDPKIESAYDKIDNIIVSDSVLSGKYSMTLTESPAPAVLIGEPGSGEYPVAKDGWVEINGVLAQITAGMSAKDAYEALRNAGETAGVNVFIYDESAADSGNGFPTVSIENVDVENMEGLSFLFVSKGTGSEAKVELSCSDDAMKTLLGLTDNNLKDAAGNPVMTEQYKKAELMESTGEDGTVTTEMVEKTFSLTKTRGRNANVSIPPGEQKLSDQVTIQSMGNLVTITDRGGFKMTFEVKANIAQQSNADDVQQFSARAARLSDEGGDDSFELDENNFFDFEIEVTDIGTLRLQVGANEDQELNVRVPTINTKTLFMTDLDVAVEGGPERGIELTDKALSTVLEARAKIGAYQNSLEFSKNSLDGSIEDMTNAISRLADTDMAEEMTEYTNANVLTQASISVLAQANDLPQQVLSLLQK